MLLIFAFVQSAFFYFSIISVVTVHNHYIIFSSYGVSEDIFDFARVCLTSGGLSNEYDVSFISESIVLKQKKFYSRLLYMKQPADCVWAGKNWPTQG